MGVVKGIAQGQNNAALRKQALRIPIVKVDGDGPAAKALNNLLPFFREISQRVESVELISTTGGFAPIIAVPLEADKDGIVAGRLVHVREDGVAELAVNTNALKYCTHVVAGVLPNGGLSCFGLGHWPVCCTVFNNVGVELKLWLSEIPGHATDVEPTEEGQEVQVIGEKQGQRDLGNGLCLAVFKPVIPGIFVTSVNGQTGAVSLEIDDLTSVVSTRDITINNTSGGGNSTLNLGPGGNSISSDGTSLALNGSTYIEGELGVAAGINPDILNAPVPYTKGGTGLEVLGTAGQALLTNATVDGVEWGDVGAAYIDGGSFSDTYTSSPFDIDGGTL